MRRLKTTRVGVLAVVAGMIVASLSTPAFAGQGQPGPTPPQVGDPVTATNEVQSAIVVNGPASGGTFTLTVCPSGSGCTTTTTSTLARNARDVQVEAALETALTAAYGGTNDVSVNANRGIAYTVIFNLVNGAAGVNIEEMSANGALLTGSLQPYTVTTSTRQDGQGTVVGQQSPHNGYSAVTNYCIQCHGVHSNTQSGGGGGYALLQGQSVTATCNTCHEVFGNTETGRIDSNTITGASLLMGTTSLRSAYDLANSSGTLPAGVSGHGIGADSSPNPDDVVMQELGWGYGGFNALNWYLANEAAGPGTSGDAASAAELADGGLYCGSCHTPHGEFGQLINSTSAGYRTDAFALNVSAVQFVFLEGLVSGNTWTLGFAGQTTGNLAFDASTAAVDSALEGLSTIGAGNVAVTGTAGTYYRVEFTSALAFAEQPQLVAASTAGSVWVVTSAGGSNGTAVSPPTNAGSASAGPSSNSATGSVAAGARTWAEGSPIFQYKTTSASPTVYYLHLDASPAPGAGPAWTKCDQDAAGAPQTPSTPADALDDVAYGTCSFLTTTDSEGQDVYLYGYKLLTAYPNHSWLKAESWGVAYRGRDQARWCGSCHTSKVGSSLGVEGEFAVNGVTYHAHPTACYYCHGSPTDGTSADYPHTSNKGALLSAYPDALCIGCHTAGSLP